LLGILAGASSDSANGLWRARQSSTPWSEYEIAYLFVDGIAGSILK
jgi:hypothetical protein